MCQALDHEPASQQSCRQEQDAQAPRRHERRQPGLELGSELRTRRFGQAPGANRCFRHAVPSIRTVDDGSPFSERVKCACIDV